MPGSTKTKKKHYAKDAQDMLTGLAKEVTLVGFYAVKELTGVDLHHNPNKPKRPWEKKWGER